MFTLKQFLDSETVPEHSKGLVDDLRRYFAGQKILIVNMTDEKDDLKTGEDVEAQLKHTLMALSGTEPQSAPYSRLPTLNPEQYCLISFTGKKRKFVDYERDNDFHRFESVMNVIREARTPIIALCAGHQLFGKAYGGRIEMIGQGQGSSPEVRMDGWLNPYEEGKGRILTPDHPLFSQYLLTDGSIHHRHAEHVTGMDSRVQVLAESIAANGKKLAYILELKDTGKHMIGFQNHPERNPNHGLKQNEGPHFSGLVLLVSALHLLTVDSQNYGATKQELYLPK